LSLACRNTNLSTADRRRQSFQRMRVEYLFNLSPLYTERLAGFVAIIRGYDEFSACNYMSKVEVLVVCVRLGPFDLVV
jgi:hypothetical protein